MTTATTTTATRPKPTRTRKTSRTATKQAVSALQAPLSSDRSLLDIGKALATIFAGEIPERNTDPLGTLSAYRLCKMIQEQTGCTFMEAAKVAHEVAPTLFA